MKDQLEQRLKELRAEFESGQKMIADMEAKQINLGNTLLRISGAIQVIEEELNKYNGNSEKPLQQSCPKPDELLETEA